MTDEFIELPDYTTLPRTPIFSNGNEYKDYTVEEDAAFCEGVIKDNERWNKIGIPEADISVCFEMSAHCNWGGRGGTFSPRRFKAALDAMSRSRVVRIGDRWFPQGTSNTKARKRVGTRVCEGPRCSVDISHMHGRARFCSPRCRTAASKAQA